jgi:hypothetical protein
MVLMLVMAGMGEDDVRVVPAEGGFDDADHFLAVAGQLRVGEVVVAHVRQAHKGRAALRVQ